MEDREVFCDIQAADEFLQNSNSLIEKTLSKMEYMEIPFSNSFLVLINGDPESLDHAMRLIGRAFDLNETRSQVVVVNQNQFKRML